MYSYIIWKAFEMYSPKLSTALKDVIKQKNKDVIVYVKPDPI